MVQTTVLHSPTLESVLMVERTIQKYSQECGKYQLWKKLPKKMMYQTFQVILSYLEKSGKILIDKDGCIISQAKGRFNKYIKGANSTSKHQENLCDR